ncbi:MAG: ATP-binding protein [Marinilabiliales bacterium]|nr:ATP-binding protein [Marinilabiliales bacterium]
MPFRHKSIKWKLFINYFTLFGLVFFSVIVYQSIHEKQFRITHLENKLEGYTDLIYRFIDERKLNESKDFGQLDSLKKILPPEISRITLIDLTGNVLYDNTVSAYKEMENHSSRPEVRKSAESGSGYDIRHSTTTRLDYFYFSKKYKGLIIRSAVIFNVAVKNYLNADRAFILFFVLMFAAFGIVLRIIANRLGDSVMRLKDFAMLARQGTSSSPAMQFSDDELGVISREISSLFEQSNQAKTELLLEKEKLIGHLFVLKEGVAFFSSQKKAILNNSHFIFYLNKIAEENPIPIEKIFDLSEFENINQFIDEILNAPTSLTPSELPKKEYIVQKEGSYFTVQCLFFQDKSFEILITDNTQLMKRSMMKQQITSNISHELKTPIATVKGYLETLMNNPEMEANRQQYFIEKAFNQSERLTQLVNDIALLNKIEESSELYPKGLLEVKKIVDEVIESFSDRIHLKNASVHLDFKEKMVVNANYSLLFSVFRNLMENSLNYGGNGLHIDISHYHEDQNYHYFSFADNGPGVADEHLPRIFERFYRVDTGRSRKQGGTGLGLAIVKNAILSFKGEISVRNHKGGGLEFIFSLPKS